MGGRDYDRCPGHVMASELYKDVLRDVFLKRMRILDVGCGTGFITIILAELGHNVVGLDISRQRTKG